MEDWRDFNWALAWFAMGGKSEEGRREDFCTSQLIFYEKIGIVAFRLQKSPNFLSSIPRNFIPKLNSSSNSANECVYGVRHRPATVLFPVNLCI